MTNNGEVTDDNMKSLLHRMEAIERDGGTRKFMLHTMDDTHVYQHKHASVIPSSSGFVEACTSSAYAQFSPAYVSSFDNPNYLASEKIGYPKDPTPKTVELLVSLSYNPNVERDHLLQKFACPQGT